MAPFLWCLNVLLGPNPLTSIANPWVRRVIFSTMYLFLSRPVEPVIRAKDLGARRFCPRVSAAFVFVLTFLLFPVTGRAQNGGQSPAKAASSPETVVVTGRRPGREEREKVVWRFVYAHAKLAPKIDQLSRWIAPVCPEVQNLPEAYATFIAKRIVEVAKSAGAPVRDDCRKDIEIVFTSDPQAYMDGIAKKAPKLLGYHYVHQTKEIAKVTKPIQAWYVTATSNRIETYQDDPYHSAPGGTPGSRLSHGQLSVFDQILIVADTKKLSGYPVGQIADYLAMLSLSEAEAPDDCAELPSILDLVSSDCRTVPMPIVITDTDKAYLAGLYAMDPDEIGSLQRSAIANHMLRDSGDR